ncbi:MAG: DMT family transporter [Moorea sp. SIO3G5]|nr:DMT family transporter [Moorena sp. SIO3G5]
MAMKIIKQPLRWQVGLVFLAGVLAISTSAIFVRLAIASAGVSGVGFSLFVAGSRLTIASMLLLPAWRNLRQAQLGPGALVYASGAGICLALHFVAWITSLSFTSIAASTTLVTTTPIWVALVSWLWFKEKLTRLTVLGIGVAFVGAVLISLGDGGALSGGSNPLLGNSLALMAAVIASLYVLWGREAQQRGLSIGSYSAVAYSMGALVLLLLSLLWGVSYINYPVGVYVYILLLALFPQMVGHTSFNWLVRWINPTLVTLAILFEPVGACFLGYLIFQEVPGVLVLVGAVVLLVGVAVAVYGSNLKRG